MKFLSAATGSFVYSIAGEGAHLYNTGTFLMKAGAFFTEGFSGKATGGAIFNTGSVM